MKSIVLNEILAADLTPATERVAIRLLNLANNDNGQINLTWEQYLDIADIQSRDAARRHLIKLKQADLIHYSTNEYVYVTWLAWIEKQITHDLQADHFLDIDPEQPDLSRAYRISEDPPTDLSRAYRISSDPVIDQEDDDRISSDPPTDLSRAYRISEDPPTDLQRSDLAALSSTKLVGSIDLDLTDPEPTNLVQPEQSFELLMDSELTAEVHALQQHEEKARFYARTHEFPWLVFQVAAYLEEKAAGKARGIGALHHRINNQFRTDSPSTEFLQSNFYRRHYPGSDEEIATRQSWLHYGQHADYIMGLTRPDPNPLLDALPLPILKERSLEEACR